MTRESQPATVPPRLRLHSASRTARLAGLWVACGTLWAWPALAQADVRIEARLRVQPSDAAPPTSPSPTKGPEKSSEPKPETLAPAESKGQPPAPAVPKPSPGKRASLPSPFRKPTPSSLTDLRVMERRVKDLAKRVTSAVVGVSVGDARGSGVVISEDGLVLCAAHVCDRPGREARFVFPDGQTVRGQTMGTDHVMDAGLLKITDAGRWPHVDLGDPAGAEIGDWVLAVGHPGGFDPQRSVVVRLGRIIQLAAEAIQSDCTLTAGDSGGPLFDMYGRVIGIHSRISETTADNYHVPIGAFYSDWERLVRAETWGNERPARPPYVGADGVDDPAGCRLQRVDEAGPAFKAGLKAGDVVTKFNDQEVKDRNSFLRLVMQTKPGDEVKLAVQREEQTLSLTVKVESSRGRRGR